MRDEGFIQIGLDFGVHFNAGLNLPIEKRDFTENLAL